MSGGYLLGSYPGMPGHLTHVTIKINIYKTLTSVTPQRQAGRYRTRKKQCDKLWRKRQKNRNNHGKGVGGISAGAMKICRIMIH